MKMFRGFEALEYVLKNRDKVLYNRKGDKLYYNLGMNRLCITGCGDIPPRKDSDYIIVNSQLMYSEWSSEPISRVLMKIYLNDDLANIEVDSVFDTAEDIENLIKKLEKRYTKLYKIKSDDDDTIRVTYEIFM